MTIKQIILNQLSFVGQRERDLFNDALFMNLFVAISGIYSESFGNLLSKQRVLIFCYSLKIVILRDS